MYEPRNVKYRRVHRMDFGDKGLVGRGSRLAFGVYGIKSISAGVIGQRELEAGRMVLRRGLKKTGGVWLRVFTDIPITSKKIGVRMGKGKGNVVKWGYFLGVGHVIYELSGVSEQVAKKLLRVVSSKLSVKTKFVKLRG